MKKKRERGSDASTGYNDIFKLEVITDLLNTGDHVEEVAKRNGIATVTLYRWLSIFDIKIPRIDLNVMKDQEKEALVREIAELKREREILKAERFMAEAKALCQETLLEHMCAKYHIDVKKDRFKAVNMLKQKNIRGKKISTKVSCEILGVSRDGYYKCQKANDKDEVKATSVLLYCMHIRESLPKAGVDVLKSLCNEYFKERYTIGRDWLADLLRANGLLLRQKHRKLPHRTTNGVVNHGFDDHLNTIPKRILSKSCEATVSDITYIKCKEGFLYLSLTMDAYSRVIMGFDLRRDLTTAGPMNALKQTVQFYQKHGFDLKGLIFHSDRGCQYVSKEMTEYEDSVGIITSVTQCGDPLHNALAERLNGTIKNDWLYNYEEMNFEEGKSQSPDP